MAGHEQSGASKRGRKPSNQQRSRPVIRRGTVRLTHEVARRIRSGHPWVYRESMGRRGAVGRPGDPIELVDWDGDFVARGLMDGETAIAVRVMTRNPRETIGDELVTQRIRSAVGLRRAFFDFERQQAIRIINSECDGLPAMVVDRYGDYLVVQLYSSAAVPLLDAAYDALEAELAPEAIYEQRRFRSLGGGAPPGAELVRGRPAPVEISVQEGDLKFYADVTAPLSTGLFPDLRSGREVVAKWSKGRRVLNLFSFTGAISVYAAHGGATSVCAVDVSAKANARARRNFALNGFDPEAPEHIAGDAFKTLAKFVDRDRKFDLVIIDPPAFASGVKGGKPWSATKHFGELVHACLDVLEPGGLLIAASSTLKLSPGDFEECLAEGALRAGTTLRIIERCSLPADFPRTPGFPESNYLKFMVAVRD